MATATSIQYVQKMFIAYLSRGASTEALEYWGNEIDAKGEAGKDALFFDLYNSAEGKAFYEGKTQDEIINQIYQNAFERDAKDAGKTYYKGELDSGALNLVSMAGAIVDSADTAGAEVFDYKNQAADYYRTQIDAAADQSFDKTESLNAVKDVDGPNTLAASKATTDAIASGKGESFTLTTGTDAPTMTAGDDTVTGTVGTGATFGAADTIDDGSTTDEDTLTITGDNGFTSGTVTKVETVNVSLARQNGAAFSIEDAGKITGGTINLTVAEKVTVAGIEVTGETEVVFNTDTGNTNSDSIVSNLNTVNVTSLTSEVSDAGVNSAAIAIVGDADLKTVILTGVDDNDTAITTANNDSTISIEGGANTNDSASITAVGKVDLDVDGGGTLVEEVTLAGSGGAVAYTVTGATANLMKYTTAGDQAITLTGAANMFDGSSITQGGTGTLGFSLTTAGDLDVSTLTVAGGVSLAADQGAAAKTFKVASGTAVSIDATQNVGATLTLDANDTATDSALTLNVNERAGILKTEDVDTITINTNDSKAITIAAIDMDANDTNVSVGGSNDVSVTGAAVAGGDLSVVGLEVGVAAATATKGDLVITASGGAAAGGTLTAQNDITVTATNDVDVVAVTTGNAGNVVITGNDVDATGTIALADGNLTLKSTGSKTDIDAVTITKGGMTATSATTFNITGALAATNDVALTSTAELTVDAITTTKGGVTLSGNDVSIDGDVSAAAGLVTVTATNDAATSDINNKITAAAIQITDGKWDADDANGDDAEQLSATGGSGIIVSGDAELAGTTGANLKASSVTITSTSDQKILKLTEAATTQGVVLSAGTSSGDITVTNVDLDAGGIATLVTGSGKDSITINDGNATAVITSGGDVDTITLTAVRATGSSVNAGGGDDIITITPATAIVVNGGEGNDKVTISNAGTSGTVDMGDGANDEIVLATGDYSLGSDPLAMKNVEEVNIAGGSVTFDWAQLSGNDTAFELKGNGAATKLFVDGSGTGGEAIDLSGITGNALAVASTDINASAGTNTITGAESLVNDIQGGTGVDTIVGGDGADTIDGGADNDVITGGEGADQITGAAGNDSITLTETTATADNVILTASATNGQDTITGFAAGGGADTVTLVNADTLDGTGTGVATFGVAVAALVAGAAVYDGGANLDADVHDVSEIETDLSANGDLDKAGVTDGTELLKALSSTAVAATGIKTNANGAAAGDDMYIVTYQGGKAFLYNANDADGNGTFVASEITLVGTFNGIADNAFAVGDFLIP